MYILAFILILISLPLFWQSSRLRRTTGLPGGHIIYTDTRGWGRLEQPLYDPGLDLTGKPDYLLKQEQQVIPIEVKTGQTPSSPYDSHIYQLAAYCHLVESAYHQRPSHGILHYPGRDFQVDYTPQLEAGLRQLLSTMQQAASRRELPRSHNQPARCRHCGYRQVCDQKLE